MSPPAIVTPCVKTCVVDDESGLCLGCLRTLAEVAAWTAFSDAERAAIMADLPARRSRIGPRTTAPQGEFPAHSPVANPFHGKSDGNGRR